MEFLINHCKCGATFVADVDQLLPDCDSDFDLAVLITGPCPKCHENIVLRRSNIGEPLSKEEVQSLENLQKVKWFWYWGCETTSNQLRLSQVFVDRR